MNALDVVVLPYEQSLSNAVMSLSFGKRVLMIESAWSSDLAAALGADVVRLYRPPLRRADLESSLINSVDPGEVIDRGGSPLIGKSSRREPSLSIFGSLCANMS